MITPTVWTTGPVTLTEAGGGLADAVTWQLIAPVAGGDVLFSGGVDSASATSVVFSPVGATPGTYTVALFDSAGTQILRYLSALAVISAAPAGVPDGVQLEWLDDWGAVRFTAGGMGPSDTVKIIGPGGVLQTIRGYEDATWHEGAAAGYGYAFEMPLGVLVSFTVVDVGTATYTPGDPFTSITTPEGRAWLRDLHQPLLSLEVGVVSTGTEEREARQAVHKVAGRGKPIVRWDVRGSRQGTISLKVENVYNGLWLTTYRDRVDTLLESGRPLLLSMCHTKGFPACYMAIANVRYTRVSSKARWNTELDYIEVDNPVGVDVVLPAEVTYEQAQQIPPSATYADWAATTYLDIATRTST